MSPAHRVDSGSSPEGEGSHVEQGSAPVVVSPETQEIVATRCEGSPRGAEMVLHQMERKGIVAGWNRCMSCEDRTNTDLSQRIGEILAMFHEHS